MHPALADIAFVLPSKHLPSGRLQNICQLFLGSFKIPEKCYEETAKTLKPIRDRNILILIFWGANSHRILLIMSIHLINEYIWNWSIVVFHQFSSIVLLKDTKKGKI